MKYTLFKLRFTSAVHFGTGGLTTTANTLMADTVFSALCTEAVKSGQDPAPLVDAVMGGRLRISDALPFIGDRFYVPKPLAEITTDKEVDSSVKKSLKKLSFVPIDGLSAYMSGTMDIDKEARILTGCLGQEYLAEKAAVETGEEARPYAVDLYRYHENSGLYICLGYERNEDHDRFRECLRALSYAGIGGKTSAGYGRFVVEAARPGKQFEERLCGGELRGAGLSGAELRGEDLSSAGLQCGEPQKNWQQYMSLSVAIPAPLEMAGIMDSANIRVVKRSGWVTPASDAEFVRKRRDVYMFAAGSVFGKPFRGCMFDLQEGEGHPVLRYGYPMLVGVK